MRMISTAVHAGVTRINDFWTEEGNILRFLSRVPRRDGNLRILDVGCGYGRNILLLRDQGYTIVGVEANAEIVAANVAAGLACYSVAEFDATNEQYDVLLLSHVIEHFQPDDLLVFMDHYLDRLKPDGYLIIATPINSPYFYDDFDHVRPYSPVGIHMVFSGSDGQVKYYGRNKIELIDLWFRRAPYRMVHYRGRFLGGQYHIRLLNLILAVLFRMSFQLIGRCDGWMGLYRKKA